MHGIAVEDTVAADTPLPNSVYIMAEQKQIHSSS